jgi:hypothetical protein
MLPLSKFTVIALVIAGGTCLYGDPIEIRTPHTDACTEWGAEGGEVMYPCKPAVASSSWTYNGDALEILIDVKPDPTVSESTYAASGNHFLQVRFELTTPVLPMNERSWLYYEIDDTGTSGRYRDYVSGLVKGAVEHHTFPVEILVGVSWGYGNGSLRIEGTTLKLRPTAHIHDFGTSETRHVPVFLVGAEPLSAVPEPGSWFLACLGIAALITRCLALHRANVLSVLLLASVASATAGTYLPSVGSCGASAHPDRSIVYQCGGSSEVSFLHSYDGDALELTIEALPVPSYPDWATHAYGSDAVMLEFEVTTPVFAMTPGQWLFYDVDSTGTHGRFAWLEGASSQGRGEHFSYLMDVILGMEWSVADGNSPFLQGTTIKLRITAYLYDFETEEFQSLPVYLVGSEPLPAIPEPAAWQLAGIGGVLLLERRFAVRRR